MTLLASPSERDLDFPLDDEAWIEDVKVLLQLYLEEHEFFVAREFTDELGIEPRSAMGSVVAWALESGFIIFDRLVESQVETVDQRGHTPRRQWRSMLYEG